MTLVFVDTSAWLALVDRHEDETDAVTAVVKAPGTRLVTSTYVFDETVTIVKSRIGHDAAVKVGTFLRSGEVELMPLEGADEEAAWRLFTERRDKNYSFTDCTSFVIMRRLGLKVAVTLDDDFKKEKFTVKP